MIDLAEKDQWYLSGTVQSLAYEFIRKYDLDDLQTDSLVQLIANSLAREIFTGLQIKKDWGDFAYVLYLGPQKQKEYLSLIHPELFDDMIYRLELMYKREDRVVEGWFIKAIVYDNLGPFDHDRLEEIISSVYLWFLDNSEYVVYVLNKEAL